METFEDTIRKITADITTENVHIRSQYLNHFHEQVSEFSQAMARAFLEWRELDRQLGDDEKKGYVSALVYCAVALHISSMKLFLSGHIIPAGNLHRQVTETVALASLASAKHLDFLDRFMKGKYSTQKAIQDAERHAKKIGLNAEAINVLKLQQRFYHNYSHPSHLMIAQYSTSDGDLLFGTSFDNEKLHAYRKEVSVRVSLAQVFGGFVKGVKTNLSKWPIGH